MADADLAGRVCLVTGAASGIGLAVARRLVLAGGRVVAFDLSTDRLGDLEAELGDAVECVVGDVRSPEDNERAAAAAVARYGSLDVLIGNAGVFDGNVELDALDAGTLRAAATEIFGINVLGYLLAARAATPHLRRSRGSIVFTVSNAGFHPGSGGGILYTVSKHAVVGVVRQLAYELAPEVRVNGVAPGGTMTDLRIAASLQDVVGTDRHFADAERSERGIRQTNPLRVVASPEDHADLYLLLASPSARAITGEIVSSDGGLAVRGLGFDDDPTSGDES
jgi:NAD(P)-dependent dehydrogenase (short-subunit alcohol dehydrogenase family)